MADREIRARLTYDVTQAQVALDQLGAQLDKLEQPITIHASVVSNIAKSIAFDKIRSEFSAFQRQANQLSNIKITIKIDNTSIIALKKELAHIDDKPIETRVLVDDSKVHEAERSIRGLATRARELAGTTFGRKGIVIPVDDRQVIAAEKQVTNLQGDLVAISKQSVTVHIDVDRDNVGLPPAGMIRERANHWVTELGRVSQAASNLPGKLGQLGQAGTNLLGKFGSLAGEAEGAGSAMAGMGEGAAAGAAGLGAVAAVALPVVAAIAAVVVSVGAAVLAFKQMVEWTQQIVELAGPAGDLNESLNAVNLTFDDMSDGIIAMSKTASTEFGLTQRSFLDLSRSAQTLLKGLGFTSKEATGLVLNIAKQSRDLGSAFNISSEQAMESIQRGLQGEYERLETIGLSITAVQVQNEAMRLGLATSAEDMDAHSRALALLSLVTSRAKDTANDFGNTMATSLPNQLKVARSSIEDMKTQFSSIFLGTAIDIMKVVNSDLIPNLKNLTRQLVHLGKAVMTVVGPFFVQFTKVIADMVAFISDNLETLVAKGAALWDWLDPGAADRETGIHNFFKNMSAQFEAEDLKDKMDKVFDTESLDELINKSRELKFQEAQLGADALKKALKDIVPDIKKVGEAVEIAFAPNKFTQGLELATLLADIQEFRTEAAKTGFAPITPESLATDPRFRGGFIPPAQLALQGKLNAILVKRAEIVTKIARGELGAEWLTGIDLQIASLNMFVVNLDKAKTSSQEFFDAIPPAAQLDPLTQEIKFADISEQVLSKFSTAAEFYALLQKNPRLESFIRVHGIPEGVKASDELRRALKILDGSITIPVVDRKTFDEAVKAADRTAIHIDQLDGLTAVPIVDVDTARLNDKVVVAQGVITAINDTTAKPTIDANTDPFNTKAAEVTTKKEDLSKPVSIGVALVPGELSFWSPLARVLSLKTELGRLISIPLELAAGAVTKVFQDLKDGLARIAAVPINFVIGNWVEIINRFREMFNISLPDWFPKLTLLPTQGNAEGGVINKHVVSHLAEGDRPEVVIPLTKPWSRQMELLEESGILSRLEAQFTAEENARLAVLNHMLGGNAGWGSAQASYPSYDALATAIEKAVEKAATTVLERARPVKAEFHVPPTRNPDEQVRMILHKLRRM